MILTATKVDSRAVSAWQYDDETRTLRVEFVGGATYDYLRVSTACIENLTDPLRDHSTGQYVNICVKPTHACVWVGDCVITNGVSVTV